MINLAKMLSIKDAKLLCMEYCNVNGIKYMNQRRYSSTNESIFTPDTFTNNKFFICLNKKCNKVLRKEGDFKNVKVLREFPYVFWTYRKK